MPLHTHQTVRLARGQHLGPEDGACVMELASMLAGEPFSDHPHSVCPVIAAFLRVYNDRIDDERRQDLYRFASLAVGSRSSMAERQRRIRMCTELVAAARQKPRRGRWRLFGLPPLCTAALNTAECAGAAAGEAAAKRAARDPAAHAAALRFVERLIAAADDSPVDHPVSRMTIPCPLPPVEGKQEVS
jgi:hypothetical protein